MRWLADENIPRSTIAYLRDRGEDVVAVAELSPNVTDEAVIRLAREANRILLSFDRDHGELIFGHGVLPPRAVIYLRLDTPDLQALQDLLAGLIMLGEEALAGLFTTVNKTGIRQRAFPIKS